MDLLVCSLFFEVYHGRGPDAGRGTDVQYFAVSKEFQDFWEIERIPARRQQPATLPVPLLLLLLVLLLL